MCVGGCGSVCGGGCVSVCGGLEGVCVWGGRSVMCVCVVKG